MCVNACVHVCEYSCVCACIFVFHVCVCVCVCVHTYLEVDLTTKLCD